MEPMTIREILEAVDGKLLGEFSDLDLTVKHVFTDSRNPDPGALFIPLVGERFDGHAFLNEALEGGAAGCFTQRERESYLPGKFYIKVGSTQKALRDLARHYKQKFRIPFVAVTGSVGKTTTKDMVAAVLGERFKVLKTEGNFNNEVGLPLTLLRLNSNHEICVVEMGMNHFGEIARGVLRFAPTKMRMNILKRGDGITILNDAYNANPQSMRAAVEVLSKSGGDYKIAVLGDMFELGPFAPTLHAGVGAYLGKAGIDCLVAVGELARHIYDAAKDAMVPQVYWCETKEEAKPILAELVKPNSTILVKASRGMAFEELVDDLKRITKEP